jgi:hypothetical protein
MTPGDWERLINETSFGHVARASYVGTGLGPLLLVEREAPDRDPPHAVRTWRTGFFLPHGPAVTRDAAIAVLRERVEGIAVHEVREQMTVGGERVFDPHRILATSHRGGAA